MAEANGGAGRPTVYQDEYAEQARKICEQFGATDYELSVFFEVSERTIYRWKVSHPEFCQALKMGKEVPDDRVEKALYHRALGYTHEEEQLHHYQGVVIRTETVKHYPPDVTACLAWLNNRRPDQWRQKPDSAPIDADTLIKKIEELNAAQQAMV